MPDPKPSDMTLKQMTQLRIDSGKEIAAILNRFTDQTSFVVVGLGFKSHWIRADLRYTVNLDARIPRSDSDDEPDFS